MVDETYIVKLNRYELPLISLIIEHTYCVLYNQWYYTTITKNKFEQKKKKKSNI